MTSSLASALQHDQLINALKHYQEIFWYPPESKDCEHGLNGVGLRRADIEDAEQRLTRFAPYLAKVFTELEASHGRIESEMASIPNMQKHACATLNLPTTGQWWLKKTVTYPFQVRLKHEVGYMRYWHMLKS